MTRFGESRFSSTSKGPGAAEKYNRNYARVFGKKKAAAAAALPRCAGWSRTRACRAPCGRLAVRVCPSCDTPRCASHGCACPA